MWKTLIRIIGFLTLGIGLAWGLFSPVMEASWSPVDDHELMTHLEGGDHISFARLRRLLSRDLSGTGRYHPLYDTLRSIEVFLWGDQLWLWFFLRMVIFAGAVTVSLVILTRFFGIGLASSIVFWFFTKDFWADIIARLGPSESYALLGWAILSLATFSIIRNTLPIRAKIWWLVLVVGTGTALFAKENMIIASIVPVLLILDQWYFANTRSLISLIAVFGVLIASCLMGYGILRATASGTDVYGNAATATTRIEVLRSSFYSRRVQVLAVFTLLTALLCLFMRDRRVQRKLYWISCVLCFSLLLYLSQFTFYMGKWPTGTRYDFPGVLSSLFIASLLVWIFLRLVSKMTENQAIKTVLLAILSVGFLFLALRHMGARNILIRTRNYVEMTKKFGSAMEQIEAVAKESPATPVVLESSSVNDLELVHAIQVYLRMKHISPNVFLRLHHGPYEDAFAQSLYLSLQNTSVSGTDLIHPITGLGMEPCLAVGLSSNSLSDCSPIGVITGQW